MIDAGLWEKLFRIFGEWPGILALLLVIYWQRQTIRELVEINQGGSERATKLITLLEILVNRNGVSK